MFFRNFSLLLCCFFTIVCSGFKQSDDCNPVTSSQLRTMIVQLGYNVKDISSDPGKEKYELTITTGGLDIPIGVELSASTKFIWLTVNLSMADSTDAAKNFSLLKQNSITQPAQFYISSKDRLMMGLPVENKGVTNFLLREKLELIATKVSDTKSFWQ